MVDAPEVDEAVQLVGVADHSAGRQARPGLRGQAPCGVAGLLAGHHGRLHQAGQVGAHGAQVPAVRQPCAAKRPPSEVCPQDVNCAARQSDDEIVMTRESPIQDTSDRRRQEGSAKEKLVS